MSSQRNIRAEKRESQKNPTNFTCGVCRQVHKFNKGYLCENEMALIEDLPAEVI